VNTNFVLIDFENVQPQNLGLLNGGQFKVRVFLGANQTKVPVQMMSALQPLGSNAEFVQVSGTGKNALDFHIAYYIGRLAVEHPGSTFHVVSKDTGFDPLIRHLRSQKISCQRSASIDRISRSRAANAKPLAEKVDAIVSNFARRKQCLPKTVKALESTIKAVLVGQLLADDLSKLITELERRRLIEVTDGKVTYRLDAA